MAPVAPLATPLSLAMRKGFRQANIGLCVGLVPCVIVGRDENDTIIFFMDFPK